MSDAGSVKLFDFLQELLVIGDSLLNIADHAASIDQKGYSAGAVKVTDRIIFIGNKREGNTVLLAKFFVCCQAVAAYTQDLGAEAFKFFDIFLEGLELPFSDRRIIGKVKCQHHVFEAKVLLKADRPLLRYCSKPRRLVADL